MYDRHRFPATYRGLGVGVTPLAGPRCMGVLAVQWPAWVSWLATITAPLSRSGEPAEDGGAEGDHGEADQDGQDRDAEHQPGSCPPRAQGNDEQPAPQPA
jgi:hypothetical protein